MILLRDLCLVEEIKENKEKKNGLIQPTQAEQFKLAKVLIVGKQVQHVKVGDTVKIYLNSGTGLKFEDKKCLLVHEGNEKIKGDIVAIM